DRRLDRRAVDVVFVERYLSAEVGQAAFDREEQHLGAELHRRILRVNCPNSRGALRADCLWLHPDISFIFFKSAIEIALEIVGYLIALLKRKVIVLGIDYSFGLRTVSVQR